MSSQKIFDKSLELAASALQSTSTNSTGVVFEYASIEDVTVVIDVTAVTGTTPTCVPSIQVTNDGGTTWKTVASCQALIAAGRYELSWTGLGARNILAPSATQANNQVRLSTVLGGTTPNFTLFAFMTKD